MQARLSQAQDEIRDERRRAEQISEKLRQCQAGFRINSSLKSLFPKSSFSVCRNISILIKRSDFRHMSGELSTGNILSQKKSKRMNSILQGPPYVFVHFQVL